MGAGGSKQTGSSSGSRHVFASETPVQFSQGLVDSLQSSAETDSSRAQTLELHIQNRVTEELERIRAREKQTLADLEKRLADANEAEASQPKGSSLSLDAPRVPFAGGFSQETTEISQISRDVSSQSVAQDIDSLRSKLAERHTIRELDTGVEKSREEVVKCLRGNERRPLDCWREVDAFKKEVARMEKDWVDKVIS